MSRLLKRLLTQSFPGRQPGSGEAGEGSPGDAPEAPEAYESRAFGLWWEGLSQRGQLRLLDLGSLRPGTLAFFGERDTALRVVGLEPEAGLDTLAAREGEVYDGALCWDLLNYLEESVLVALGAWLAERLTPGAPVFLALATRAPYRDRPDGYEVVDGSRLRTVPATTDTTRTRLLSGPRLGRLWPQFSVERSFLLRNGMQEYVLRRAAG